MIPSQKASQEEQSKWRVMSNSKLFEWGGSNLEKKTFSAPPPACVMNDILLPRLQSMAASAAFSSGSPTSSPSSSTREWHDASTHCTSNDTSFTGVSRYFEEEEEGEEEEGGEEEGEEEEGGEEEGEEEEGGAL